ncbi:N-6 DNA methylase [Actinomyces sp. 565]|uniref:N-6 DNA methylase n=1 Tax=Actinomyces sp. 565 TaxID=2057794 RepID=UPI0013A69321|nr:N-6 DNA methylase [Actinomyces sp. 565]NDR53903.1 N-6 DNA methylase [Actinomyces sp. 565]
METLTDIVARIARRDPVRAEATLQADIRSFILSAELNLDDEQVYDVPMESQLGDGTRRRIDIETGSTVIEVKKDLTRRPVLHDAVEQLGRYVRHRCDETGTRFLGILTDGAHWYLYVPDPRHGDKPDGDDARHGIIEADHLLISSGEDAEELRYWLGTVLATRENLPPTGEAIIRELGSNSPAHAADHTTLRALYAQSRRQPEVALKHELWGKMLRTAFGSGFKDDESLFIDHTLLVLTAEIIAHAALGLDIAAIARQSPASLATGTAFAEARIRGVVESDFFDWPTEVPDGLSFIRSLTTRISRFDWSHPDHDVLKHLYEAVISPETRQALGEYYTPDWLAEAMVEDTVTDPLSQRVLDPSCGSGTFLFHAVRAYLAAAQAAGIQTGEALTSLTSHVYGMDLHPVAVTLARVTYLLAIGTDRLQQRKGALSVPVFLGDSLQWEERADLLTDDDAVTISTAGSDLAQGQEAFALESPLFDDDLVFPRSIIANAERFDELLSEMARLALDSSKKKPDNKLIDPVLDRLQIADGAARDTVRRTFSKMRDLQRRGRDHIWGYYVRNLIRPLWLALPDNRVDVLVGNPPWLRYNKMSGAMQDRYRLMAQAKGLLSGPKGASSRDLSTLFVVRALDRYGTPDARFAFVMPHGTITRYPHEGFRSGQWGPAQEAVFATSWDLQPLSRATGFPMTSCVVRGWASTRAGAMSPVTREWTGKRVSTRTPWSEASTRITRAKGRVHVQQRDDAEVSPYDKRFRQGAIIVPRVLFFIEKQDAGPLGLGAGRVKVLSRRSSLEKAPWKQVESLTGTVEEDFLHPVHLGETLLPYRMAEPLTAVIPISLSDPRSIADAEEIERYADLDAWWEHVEYVWREHRVARERKPLLERMDYASQLSAQLPLSHVQRVVYSKAGNQLTASRVSNPSVLIDHKLYWAPVRSEDEGRYLVGILNSRVLLERIQPMQAVGLFGPRDFDKNVFKVPFGGYDAADPRHQTLVKLVERAEELAASTDVTGAKDFKAARKTIRDALDASGLSEQIEPAVDAVLPHVDL